MDMTISFPAILLGLGGKCILNWALIFFQKKHIWRSFVCVFSLSVSIVDTMLTLFVTFIHLLQDINVMGLRLTEYHLCLLVQILGYIHSTQHFVVLILTMLEHIFTVSRQLQYSRLKATWFFHVLLMLIVWLCSTLYVFKISSVYLFWEDAAQFQINHCWISSSSVISEIAIFIGFILLCFILWHSLKYIAQLTKNPHPNPLMTLKTQIRARFLFIYKVVCIFLDTWAPFLIFLFLHVVLPVEMPSYLSLNCAWFGFLNSLLIAVALCVVDPSRELAQGLVAVPPDSFCVWKRRFRSATDITQPNLSE